MSMKSIVYPLSMGVDSGTIGNLADLTTTNKSNLVGAINENVTNISGNATKIGDLTTLTTTEKSNLVGAINELDSKVIPISQGGTGAITATNARTNLEVMKAFRIYSNTSGTQGTVTFNTGYTSTEFDYIKIIYKVEDMYADVTVKPVVGTGANLITAHYSDSDEYMYINTRTMMVATKSLTLKNNTHAYMRFKQNAGNVSAYNDIIYVTDVIGYKY